MEKFNIVHRRKNTRSLKWDSLQAVFSTEDVLPMWVADMDFKAPEAVNDALLERVKHGIYGYTVIDDPIKDSIVNWASKRYNWDIAPEWLTFSSGVVTSLHAAVQAFTNRGDRILIQTPVYPPFYQVIQRHNRKIVKNSLIQTDNGYRINFNDFEQKLTTGVKAFILCSPHNPGGRVWTRNELEEMARLCMKHNVLIISDEIHADIVFPGHQHIPIASLSQEVSHHTVTCMSPTKTFNLAGLQVSYVVTENNSLRNHLNNQFQKQGDTMLNTMGITALEAAYNYGDKWVNNIVALLHEHQQYVTKTLEKYTNLKVMPIEGTYLLWIDCSALQMDHKDLERFMIEQAKVGLNSGYSYGEEGKSFMRMNIACPKATLEEGVKRIVQAVKNLSRI
ncbi:MAG TPA: PatB family C-S lyase [Bacillota bacterium]